ncbi:envelope stress sensor histidine kinase CpxA [Thorsellia kenyensis]|uniref:histidine kinase n=1 Tax=Thorsellia kenyensis TaxID=1549888 RepID=A0ABV6C9N2_9GAMM
MFNHLSARIFAIFWFTVVLVVLMVLFVPKLDMRNIKTIEEEENTTGSLMVQRLEATLDEQPNNQPFWTEKLARIVNSVKLPEVNLFLVNSEGLLIGAKRTDVELIRHFIGVSNDVESPKKKRYDKRELIGPFLVNDENDVYLLYMIRQISDSQSAFLSQLFDDPILLLLVIMLVSTPLLLWLSWSLAKPARRLKLAADKVAQGDLSIRPELESGPVEFFAAGRSFNHMVQSLEKMMNVQHRLLSDISHELRTPLTRLQLASALMRRKNGETEELNRIEMETMRLDLMINDLLELSRKQYSEELSREEITAQELWHNVIDDAKFEAEQKNKCLVLTSDIGDWMIYGVLNALESAIENIIRNALRYSYGKIEVGFASDGKEIIITVDDDGPGVKENELEHLFRPFYRTDEARDRESGGKGLGLAIVEAVVEQHNGRVKAEKSHLGGLRMTVVLPIYEPVPA